MEPHKVSGPDQQEGGETSLGHLAGAVNWGTAWLRLTAGWWRENLRRVGSHGEEGAAGEGGEQIQQGGHPTHLLGFERGFWRSVHAEVSPVSVKF